MSFRYVMTEKKLFILAFIMIGIYLAPLYILGENAHIRVHDNLDSNLAWYKVLSESGKLLAPVDSTVPQIINGLPRNAFGTEFSLIVWLYAIFPTIFAYALSQTITRVFAFIGMYILLRDHFIQNKDYVVINVGVALAFSLTPFWPSGMLSTLGMPLALWAFLHIRNGQRTWKQYLVLTLVPFYSSIVLGFFFFLFAIGVFWLVDFLRGKRNWYFLLAIIYMSLLYVVVEYRLFYSFLFDEEPNSRDEYFHARLPLWRVIRLTFKNFILGHNHVMTVHGLFIMTVLLLGLYLVITKKLWKQEKAFTFLLFLNFILSAWYAFWFYKGWLPLTQKFHFLDTFNFARFHFLRPLVIYVGFALGLKMIWNHRKGWKTYAISLLIAQILLLFCFNDEIIYRKKPSVAEFYSVELFEDIKSHIGLSMEDYRIASIGIHPAIAQYNGFYTLDTYNNFYPLTYKYKFREIIEKELTKNKTIRTYFDEWGGRCYIFTDELGKHYMFKKNSKKTLKNLELNMDAFKELGGLYIFSAVPIENAKENHLLLERTFQSDLSVWKIYLYKVL
ncbi:membrane protein [Bacillus sp. SA1-12]|nr:membrane protein [Bacillus sp. SA1-12]